ncbi:MAG: undecaprenyl-phosphate glucose phosphotransferase [Blastomonas sp.]|nr:undecaprenyl-phosphate glucose phosphotransferase [Blastomonas sp.]|tara:strand:+ start:4765 stop:6165 length:1401 start_codon:yes stop_codon:yes gene_type:complete
MGKKGFVRNNINQFAVLFRFLDLLFIQVSLIAVAHLYGIELNLHYYLIGVIACVAFLFSAEMLWLYRSWRTGTSKEILFVTSISHVLMVGAVVAWMFISKTTEDYSRITISLWFFASWALSCSWRIAFRYVLFIARKNGRNSRSVAIIGANETTLALIQEIQSTPEAGYNIVGVYDDRAPSRLELPREVSLNGNISNLYQAVEKDKIDTVFIALPMTANKRIEQVLRVLGDTKAQVHLVPNFFVYNLLHSRICNVGDMQTVSVFDSPMKGAMNFLKRVEDILLASVILAIISVPMLIIAAAVKLTSKGPVIFKQNRYGMDGKKIKVWKFRSMTVTENGDAVTQATKNDARITKVGAFLRRTSLDELPQFINVLQGHMSVVGPRPHAVAHNEAYRKKVEYYMLRHRIKPGITGWAQVNGWRGETDTLDKMQKRVEYDLEYIKNWSLWLDFKIVLFTLFKGFVNKNAY